MALNVAPFEYDPRSAAKASNPDRRRKWLIPLVLAAQVCVALLRVVKGLGLCALYLGGAVERSSMCPGSAACWPLTFRTSPAHSTPTIQPTPLEQVALKLLLDRVMDEDGCRADANGPFDEQTRKERREELKRDKVRLCACFWLAAGLAAACLTAWLAGWLMGILLIPSLSGSLPSFFSPSQEEQRRKKDRKKARASSTSASAGGGRFFAGDSDDELGSDLDDF